MFFYTRQSSALFPRFPDFRFFVFRKRFQKNQRVSDDKNNGNYRKDNPFLRRNSRFIAENADGVMRRVRDDTGNQTSAAMENYHKQEAAADGAEHLADIRDKVHPAAVE